MSTATTPEIRAQWSDLSASQRLAKAQEFLRGGQKSVADLVGLAGCLKDVDKRFTHARRLLVRARNHKNFVSETPKTRTKIRQQLALCTYKDDDLPAGRRLDKALEILQEIAPLEDLGDQESLCLAGAIFKRRWETGRDLRHLHRSLAFYLKGHEVAGPGSEGYSGYAGINAAYVLDVIAFEERQASSAAQAIPYRKRSEELRRELMETLPEKVKAAKDEDRWWLQVTLAEAYFGLQRYSDALRELEAASGLARVADWQRESTVRQLVQLAHLQQGWDAASGAQAWSVIRQGFGLSKEALEALVFGRVGLALSGGGFRASLFHIGVLARLAELDLLRHVEVLSCVSGGSIIGAYYYLELRSRLLDKTDGEMTTDEYVGIVRTVERRFLEGVRTNLRSSLATDLLQDLRMIFDPGASRTTRIGDLYESRLFSRVSRPRSGALAPKWLSELPFVPAGAPPDFNPRLHNWRRAAKVPMLVLNATTLNTGHNWQFTATWMGEAATTVDARIDGNDYLRRMYYSEAPAPYRDRGVRLGHGVAASSCVPGVFPALEIRGLYPNRTVRLVDGGVHDNQGIAATLDQDCSVILVSDASGQMRSNMDPAGGVVGGPLRSNTILQSRVRLAQHRELEARYRSSALRGLMWVHLRQALETDAVDWVSCLDPFSPEDEALPKAEEGQLAPYGILKEVQELLAGIRTDLDSFSDIEAHALMTSGYRMTENELRENVPLFAGREAATRGGWEFLGIESYLKSPPDPKEVPPIRRVLRVARRTAFKAWGVSPVLTGLATTSFLLAIFVALYAFLDWATSRFSVPAWAGGANFAGLLTLGVFAVGGGAVLARWALRTYGSAADIIERVLIGTGTLFLALPLWLHRIVIDRIYLHGGAYRR